MKWNAMAMALAGSTLVAALPSAHADEVFRQLIHARCLKCEFGVGVQTSWKTGAPKSSLTNFGKDGVLTFDAIDPRTRKARLIGTGATDVLVIPTPAGLTFVEETGTGSLLLTTVFARYDSTGSQRFVAVMSRHMDTSASGPSPSQFHGTCTVVAPARVEAPARGLEKVGAAR